MSPFAPLLKLAGKMPKWTSRAEEEQKRMKREYNAQKKREWRKKNGRH